MTKTRAIDLMPMVAFAYGESGMCFDEGNEEQVEALLLAFNQVFPMLMSRMDAEGTVTDWTVPVCGGVFSLPMDCIEVRQVHLNGCSITVRDKWYEGQIGHKIHAHGLFCGSPDLIDIGDGYATPEPWPSEMQDARYGVMAENDEDAGKVVQITGKDRYGGKVEEEITLLPYQQIASSQSALSDLTFQHKGATSGAVVGFVTYPVKRPDRILRIPHFAEVASFHRKKLPMHLCRNGALSILGKIRFFPLRKKTEEVPISNINAVVFALQAITAMKRRDLNEYNNALTMSLNELEKERQNLQPAGAVSQMSVKSPVVFKQRCWS